jgi:hypothetical protein
MVSCGKVFPSFRGMVFVMITSWNKPLDNRSMAGGLKSMYNIVAKKIQPRERKQNNLFKAYHIPKNSMCTACIYFSSSFLMQ